MNGFGGALAARYGMLAWAAVLAAALPLACGPAGAQPIPAPPERTGNADMLWREAVALMRAGRPRAAIERLDPLVSRFPDEPSFRLELALAHFQAGDDEKAAFHFERALGGELTEGERTAVRRYLAAIEERKRWVTELSFALVAESNPGERTGAETIDIGGLPFVPDQRPESGTGAELGAALVLLPRLSRDVSLRLQASLRERRFENGAFDETTGGVQAGVEFRFDRGTVLGFGAAAEWRRLAGEDFSTGLGLYATAEAIIDPTTRIGLRATVSELEHETLTDRDGLVTGVSINAVRVVSPRFLLRGGLGFGLTDAVADFESGTTAELSLGLSYTFEGGVTVEADAGIVRDRREGVVPLFGERRDDRLAYLEVGLYSRNIDISGFTPVVGLRLEDRSSPIPLYDFTNAGLSLRFTRQF